MKRVFAFIGFTVAITLIVLNIIPFYLIEYIALSAAVLLALSLIVSKIRKARVMPIVLSSIILACALFSYGYTVTAQPQLSLDKKEAKATFSVIDIYSLNHSGEYCYIAKVESVDIPDAPHNFKLRVKSRTQLDADYFDKITATLKFYKIGDNAFNSYGYFGKGIFLSARLDDGYTYEENESKPIDYQILKLRIKIKNLLDDTFGGDTGALAAAIFIGDDSNLSNKAYSNFKICGVSHAIVVSGLHTSLLCLGIYYVLKFLRAPKPLAVLITLFGILFYVSLADFSKSSIRAGIMLAVFLISKLFKYKADTLNSLGIAVLIMCFNPFAVADISALLSVTAVLGIIVIYPRLSKLYKSKSRLVGFAFKSVSLTISVMLGTFPVCCIFFKSISLVGIILNIIFIPLLQIALISVTLFTVFNKIAFLAFLPKIVARLSLTSMLKITNLFADKFSWLNVDTHGGVFLVAAAGCLMFIGLMLIINKNAQFKATMLFTVLMLTGAFVFSGIRNAQEVTINILSSGAVVIEDRDSVLGIKIDDYSDYYNIDGYNLNGKQGIFIDCCNYTEELSTAYDGALIIESDIDCSCKIDDKIAMKIDNNCISFNIYGNTFEIIENNVIIDGISLNRKSDYMSDDDVIIYISNDEISVRRELDG